MLERYPESLVMWLAKVGGLLALFKVFILMQTYNKYVFERDIHGSV